MNESTIKLLAGRPSRGKFPVSLMQGDTVLLPGEVNPHNQKDIDGFIKKACKQLPGLREKSRKDDLRTELLQLAAPKATADPRPPRKPGEHPYLVRDGGIYRRKPLFDGGESLESLTNFTAQIVGDVVRDDGAESERAVEIEATLPGCQSRFTISAAQFASMNWPVEKMGAGAIVQAGQGARDHTRAAIQFLSPQPIPQRRVYTYTGWRDLAGENVGNAGLTQWVYLGAGASIGATGPVDGVQVELAGALAIYKLPEPPQGAERQAAIRASLGLLRLGPDLITFPVLCAVDRAPLGACDFGLHLAGPTGVFKSEVAALGQQHFGAEMDARHLPGSWTSTENAIEGLLFSAKDTVTVIDDFAPGGSALDVARYHQKADRVFRAQGNNAGRGRMRADGTLRPPKPPRGLVVSTGEEIPKGQSLRARTFIDEISKGDISPEILTCCQADARSGLYAAAMAAYVQYLAGHFEQVRQSFRGDIEKLRDDAARGDGHCRTPDIVANLALGLRYFLAYAVDAGAISEAERGELWERGWAALKEAAEKQAAHQAANEPARRFIELLTSALASGRAHLADAKGNAPLNAGAWGWRCVSVGAGGYARDDWQAQGDRIGWIDGEDILLNPDASYRAAQGMAGGGGDGLSVTAQTLRKRMDEKGWVIHQYTEELLSRRVLEGSKRRVIHLAGGVLLEFSVISGISNIDGVSGPKTAKMPENDAGFFPGALDFPASKSGISPAGGPENGPDAGNDGNDGKRAGDTLDEKAVIEL